MKSRKYLWLAAIALLAVILSSCTLGAAPEPTEDASAIQTQALQLVLTQAAMQQTQTAMAIPPSPQPTATVLGSPTATFGLQPTFPVFTPGTGTPFAFNTPSTGFTALAPTAAATSTDSCHRLSFVADVTVPDGTVFRPGETFTKTWRVQNAGTCTWDDGYVLTYLGGSLGGRNIPLNSRDDFVSPGDQQDYSVTLNASCTPQKYEECWRMKDDGGFFFGSYLCVVIEVKGDPVGGCK
jgi:hypothetical protein